MLLHGTTMKFSSVVTVNILTVSSISKLLLAYTVAQVICTVARVRGHRCRCIHLCGTRVIHAAQLVSSHHVIITLTPGLDLNSFVTRQPHQRNERRHFEDALPEADTHDDAVDNGDTAGVCAGDNSSTRAQWR